MRKNGTFTRDEATEIASERGREKRTDRAREREKKSARNSESIYNGNVKF